MDLDELAEWLERHPEIASITITEIVETTLPAVETWCDE
jgi:hypothetical protein